jgi:uncharacterized membrane protein
MKVIKRIPQMVLGLALMFAGFGHLGPNRVEFQAQVPNLFKDYADQVVLLSGVVEILLGASLLVLWKYRVIIGILTAAFFVAIFWGNISQYVNQIDAFGLNSDRDRFIRLLFQPVLVLWALLSTGALKSWLNKRKAKQL